MQTVQNKSAGCLTCTCWTSPVLYGNGKCTHKNTQAFLSDKLKPGSLNLNVAQRNLLSARQFDTDELTDPSLKWTVFAFQGESGCCFPSGVSFSFISLQYLSLIQTTFEVNNRNVWQCPQMFNFISLTGTHDNFKGFSAAPGIKLYHVTQLIITELTH